MMACLLVLFGSPNPLSPHPKKTHKKVRVGTPLAKLSGSAHDLNIKWFVILNIHRFAKIKPLRKFTVYTYDEFTKKTSLLLLKVQNR